MTRCNATLGGFADRPGALICTGVGHPYGCTFESTSCGDAEAGCDE